VGGWTAQDGFRLWRRHNKRKLHRFVLPSINHLVDPQEYLRAHPRNPKLGRVAGRDVGETLVWRRANADNAELGASLAACVQRGRGAQDDALAGVGGTIQADPDDVRDVGHQKARNRQFGKPGLAGRLVKLLAAPIRQRVVVFDKEDLASELALREVELGVDLLRCGVPTDHLLLGERGPTPVDRAPSLTPMHLIGGAGVDGDEGQIADLAVASALIDHDSTLAGFRVRHFHN